MLYPDAKPNAAHLALAELERRGARRSLPRISTDCIRRRAVKKVLELHRLPSTATAA